MIATYLRLLIVFSVLSVLGFGGGKGIIPQMHQDAVTQYHWVTASQFTEFYTIGKLVPGPTTIFAALIGFAAAGIAGAVIAAVGMFVPSTVLMIAMDSVWARWRNTAWKDLIAHGLAPAIVGLVWSSVIAIGKGTTHSPAGYAIGIVITILMLRTKISAPALIGISGVAGIAFLR
jgi:chromate transporter